jgi:hypothetical protein
MSILDTIKNLFCSQNCNTTESTVENKGESEPVVEKEPAPQPTTEESTPATEQLTVTKLQIPEDSTLRRHFLSNLRMDIESKMPPRPTEATQRHKYDAEVEAQLEKLLNS